MAKQQMTQIIRGAATLSRQFRYEVARELGMQAETHPHPAIAQAAIDGEVPRRMVELAEQQMKK